MSFCIVCKKLIKIFLDLSTWISTKIANEISTILNRVLDFVIRLKYLILQCLKLKSDGPTVTELSNYIGPAGMCA